MKVALEQTKGVFHLKADAAWPDKSMTVIAGPSGAGKTSFLRGLLGLDQGRGKVEFDNMLWQGEGVFIPVHQRRMAWVSQHDDVFSHLTVRENLAFAMRFAAPGGLNMQALTSLFMLDPVLDQNAGALSGGQKQRLILARALLSNPRLLALDEPFGALDAEARHDLLALLHDYCAARALPIVFVSHDFETLTRLANFMIYMKNGQVVEQGPLNDCLLNPQLPYRYREDACVVLRASANGYDGQGRLNILALGDALFQVPGAPLPPGIKVNLRLRAGDISLSRSRHQDSSVLNILPAKIVKIEHANTKGPLAPGLVNTTLDLAGAQVLARITKKSAQALDLAQGDEVYAQIKASALHSA